MTRTIGGQFSPEGVEVDYIVSTLLKEWEIEQGWIKIRGERKIFYRLKVGWIGAQGLATGKFELPDELYMMMNPNFKGVKISISRHKRLPFFGDFRYELTLKIVWKGKFRAKHLGETYVDGMAVEVYEDSEGKVLFTRDEAAPSYFKNVYIAKHPTKNKMTWAENYEEAVKTEDIKLIKRPTRRRGYH
jgi:hypothetical protein